MQEHTHTISLDRESRQRLNRMADAFNALDAAERMALLPRLVGLAISADWIAGQPGNPVMHVRTTINDVPVFVLGVIGPPTEWIAKRVAAAIEGRLEP